MSLVGCLVFEDEQVDELGWVLDFLPGGVEPAPRLILGDVTNKLLDLAFTRSTASSRTW